MSFEDIPAPENKTQKDFPEMISGFPFKEIDDQLRTALSMCTNGKLLINCAGEVAKDFAKKESGENFEITIERQRAIMILAGMYKKLKRDKEENNKLKLKLASKVNISDDERSQLGKFMREYYEILESTDLDNQETVDRILNNHNIYDENVRRQWETLIAARIIRDQEVIKNHKLKKASKRKHKTYPKMLQDSEKGIKPYTGTPGEAKGKKESIKKENFEQQDLL